MSRKWDTKSPTEQRKRIYERDKGICQKCLAPVPFNKSTRGHIIPRFLRGPKTDENMRLECNSCNSREKFGQPTYNVMTEEELLVHEMAILYNRCTEEPRKAAEQLREQGRYEEIPELMRKMRNALREEFERELAHMPWIALDRQHGTSVE